MYRHANKLARCKNPTLMGLRVLLLFLFALSVLVLYRMLIGGIKTGLLYDSRKMQIVLASGIGGCIVDLAVFIGSLFQNRLSNLCKRIPSRLRVLSKLNAGMFVILILGFAVLVMGPTSKFFKPPFVRIITYIQVLIAGTVLLKSSRFKSDWSNALLVSALLAASALSVASFLSDVSNHPYALTWSEGSQYYNASLFFSQRVYGVELPWPVLNPSKYLIQSIPFLIPNSSIWLHRLWEAILWISMPILTAWLLARRLRLEDRFNRWLFVLWAFLYLMIGAVYYHLLICVVLILWGYMPNTSIRQHSFSSLGIVFLASIWAGISRVNWFPVPGMLASALYFLEVNCSKKNPIEYSLKGLAWTFFGSLVSLTTFGLYILNSGNPPREFTSSFTADKLWYRWFPNSNYPLGVLPAILFVSLPLLLLIYMHMIEKYNRYTTIRLSLLASLTLILFLGGMFASTKIGGGDNLHNLDAFMTLLLIIVSFFYYDKIAVDDTIMPEKDYFNQYEGEMRSIKIKTWQKIAFRYALIVPILFALTVSAPIDRPAPKIVSNSIATIQKFVNKTVKAKEEVLFITERQLLTYHIIHHVPLIPEYEKFFLMEMALADNNDYMDRFYYEIKNHHFGLIISEPVLINTTKDSGKFGEENQVWREKVDTYLYCYYKPIRYLREVSVYILEPRPVSKNQCP